MNINNYISSNYIKIFQNPLNLKNEYMNAKPFPHICIDNFFIEDFLDKLLNEFPDNTNSNIKKFDNIYEKKIINTDFKMFGKNTGNFIDFLNSSIFINFLNKITNIKENLIADPELLGGGLHEIKKNGFLKIHADFNIHPHLKLERRINLLLYLNKDWNKEYGGHLQLLNSDKTSKKEYLPIFNRLIIFSTTSNSFHGNPFPLNTPNEITRKSLALYYYSNDRPKIEKKSSHSTIFIDESIKTKYKRHLSSVLKKIIKLKKIFL